MGLAVLGKGKKKKNKKTLTQNKIFSFFYKAPEKGQQDCAGKLTLSEDTADATVCWHYSTALFGCSGQLIRHVLDLVLTSTATPTTGYSV